MNLLLSIYIFVLAIIGLVTLFIPIAKFTINHINSKPAAFVVFLVPVLILLIPFCFALYYFFSRLL